MSGLIVIARLWLVRIAFRIASLLPIRFHVVLATSHATRIGGNLACLQAELAHRDPPVPHHVLAYFPGRGLLAWARGVLHSLAAGYRLATARVFVVDDYFFPIYVVRPRRGTTIVQTWHACGAFKRFGYSSSEKEWGAAGTVTRRVRIHANYDLCLVSSRAAIPAFAEAFGLPAERFVSNLGIPRTDLLFGADAAHLAAIRRACRLPAGRRVILYAPSFRGESVYAARHPSDLDMGLLRERLGDDHVLLLRLHPFVRSGAPLQPALEGFAIDVSGYPEVNELMLVSDILVTDYSSVIFEFALLGRPIAFFAPDHAAYERERGFYFDYRSFVPGPVFETTDALADHLRAGRFDTATVKEFAAKWFDVADGHATERLVDEVVLPALGGKTSRLQAGEGVLPAQPQGRGPGGRA